MGPLVVPYLAKRNQDGPTRYIRILRAEKARKVTDPCSGALTLRIAFAETRTQSAPSSSMFESAGPEFQPEAPSGPAQ